MKTRYMLILIAAACLTTAVADTDIQFPARRVEFATSADYKVILELGYKQTSAHDYSTNCLAGLTFVWDGKSIVVPKKGFAEIAKVQLDSVRVYGWGPSLGPESCRWVTFFFGELLGEYPDDFLTATFVFVDQKYERLVIGIPYGGGSVREADALDFEDTWSYSGSNRTAKTVGELVDRMKADMRSHRELVERYKASLKVAP